MSNNLNSRTNKSWSEKDFANKITEEITALEQICGLKNQ